MNRMKKLFVMSGLLACSAMTLSPLSASAAGSEQPANGLIDGGYFTCEGNADTARWKLMSNGDLVLYGSGTISNLDFSLSNENKAKVRRVYCEDVFSCTDIDLDYFLSDMPNMVSVNLNTVTSKEQIKSAGSIFSNCPKLKEINISRLKFDNTPYSSTYMLRGSDKIEKIVAPSTGCHVYPLPETDGYNWCDSEGNTLPVSTNSYGYKYIRCTGTVTEEPIEYSITYICSTYDAKEKGYYSWDESNKQMINLNSPTGEYGLTILTNTYWTNNEENPTTYTVEDGTVAIKAPKFEMKGYKLLDYEPKTINFDNVVRRKIEVSAVFVPEELLKEEVTTEEETTTEETTTEEEKPTTEEEKTTTSEETTRQETTTSTQRETSTSTRQETTTEVKKENTTETKQEITTKPNTEETVTFTSTSNAEKINKKASIKKLKKAGRRVVITNKSVKGYKYQISYSTDKRFKKNVKKIKTSSTQYTTGKLKSGKTYYFRTRLCKKIRKSYVYGDWSKVKKIKIK